MGRNDLCFCGSNKKQKKCHPDINSESKLAKMYALYHTFDNYALKKGIKNNCPKKCYNCCKGVHFYTTETEFLMILDYILTKMPEKLAYYINKAKAFEKEFKNKRPNEYLKIDSQMEHSQLLDPELLKLLLDDDPDPADEFELPNCIFLDESFKCSIYDIRPIVCRLYGTINKCCVNNIKYDDMNCKEIADMEQESFFIKKDDKPMIFSRPYPLFYWFSFFLDEPHRGKILNKLSQIKNTSNNNYYDYCKNLLY